MDKINARSRAGRPGGPFFRTPSLSVVRTVLSLGNSCLYAGSDESDPTGP